MVSYNRPFIQAHPEHTLGGRVPNVRPIYYEAFQLSESSHQSLLPFLRERGIQYPDYPPQLTAMYSPTLPLPREVQRSIGIFNPDLLLNEMRQLQEPIVISAEYLQTAVFTDPFNQTFIVLQIKGDNPALERHIWLREHGMVWEYPEYTPQLKLQALSNLDAYILPAFELPFDLVFDKVKYCIIGELITD